MLVNLRTTRDGPNVLANLANLAIFMQITSPEMGLTCWRIWRFLCKLHWGNVLANLAIVILTAKCNRLTRGQRKTTYIPFVF